MNSRTLLKVTTMVLCVALSLSAQSAIAQHSHSHGSSATTHSHGTQDDGHGHTVDDIPMQMLTQFIDNKYEAYLGINAPVNGQAVHFHLHLTDLSTYKPVDNAKATIKIGSATTKESTSKAGLFHLGITPQGTGVQPMIAEIRVGTEVYNVKIADIDVHESISEAVHHTVAAHSDAISLPKSWMWSNNFGVEFVAAAPFDEVIKTRGEIVPSTSSAAVIVAPTSGIISFNNSMIEGKAVDKGDVVATLKNGKLENNISARYKKLKTAYQTAVKNYERNIILAEDKIVSQKELKDSYNQMVQAKESYQGLADIYSEEGVKITAPESAVITKLVVAQNQFVEAGEAIATVQQKSSNMLRADLAKYYAKNINAITNANFIPEYSDKAMNVREIGGTKLINSATSAISSGYIPVFFSLPNSQEVIPYSYSEVYLTLSSPKDVISVPVEAISEREGLYWVYVQTGGESFEKRDVELGASNGLRRVVLKGLHEGDIVVTKGATKVRLSESSGAAIPHAHVH